MDSINIAIYCMLAACLLPIIFAWIAKTAGGFTRKDNMNPREFLAKTTGLAARANAAQNNSFESLPLFLSGVLIAEYMVVSQVAINKLALAYIVLRILYGIAYLSNQGLIRSIFWTLAMACPVFLYLLATACPIFLYFLSFN